MFDKSRIQFATRPRRRNVTKSLCPRSPRWLTLRIRLSPSACLCCWARPWCTGRSRRPSARLIRNAWLTAHPQSSAALIEVAGLPGATKSEAVDSTAMRHLEFRDEFSGITARRFVALTTCGDESQKSNDFRIFRAELEFCAARPLSCSFHLHSVDFGESQPNRIGC